MAVFFKHMIYLPSNRPWLCERIAIDWKSRYESSNISTGKFIEDQRFGNIRDRRIKISEIGEVRFILKTPIFRSSDNATWKTCGVRPFIIIFTKKHLAQLHLLTETPLIVILTIGSIRSKKDVIRTFVWGELWYYNNLIWIFW